jgi:PAS domain S-box-containing protein
MESVPTGILISTPEGGVTEANPAVLEMLGYDSKEEFLKLSAPIHYYDPKDRGRLVNELRKKGMVKDFEIRVKRKDGTVTWVSATATAQTVGGTTLFINTVQDITERKWTEKELQRNAETLRKTLGATIQAMAVTVETRDPYTAGHQRRVTNLARAIATEMGLSKGQIEGIRMATVIHDIGKITVPTDILNKPGRLTEHEFGIIKCHPQAGYDILKTIEFPWPIAQMILQHHERMDGSGYPQGLSGGEIILEARILGVADVVEAMASFRPYRPALGIDRALEEISQNRGVLYDAETVDVCLKLFTEKGFEFE